MQPDVGKILARETAPRGPVARLRRLAQTEEPTERCELCGARIGHTHRHLLEIAKGQLVCVCDACGILFAPGHSERFRPVPQRLEAWPEFTLTDAQWENFGVPISLAFFVRSTPARGIVANYPSPGGVTGSVMPMDAWQDVLYENPRLGELEADVEALLANRLGGAREYYRAPLDECFHLVGLVRTKWRGLSGGLELWAEVTAFFAEIQKRARIVRRAGGMAHA